MKLTKEEMLEWMLDKVKKATNVYDAECWLVTARTLGVNYDVDLSAYKLHCQHKNVTSAAETIQRMYMEFSTEDRFWDEIMQLIEAVRDDKANDEVSLFRKAIFQSLMPELQQTILLELAEKQKEKVEQCRFLLLLLRLFPDSASTFGSQLIDVLTDLEKNAEAAEAHENVYTQLLVCEVLPILLRSQSLKLSESVCLELFKRAIRFYLSILSSTQRRKQSVAGSGGGATANSSGGGASPRAAPRFKNSSRGNETPIADYYHSSDGVGSGSRSSDNSWDPLLQCYSLIADRCRWEVGKKLKNFRLDHMRNTLAQLETTSATKIETLFTSLLIFLNLVFKYSQLSGAAAGRENPNIVVALVPPTLRESYLPSPLFATTESESTPPPSKMTKTVSTMSFPKDDFKSIQLVPTSDNDKSLMDIFSLGIICSKLLGDGNRDELMEKLLPADKRIWVKQFVRDSQLLNGDFRRVSKELEKTNSNQGVKSSTTTEKVQLAGCYLATDKSSQGVKTLLSMDSIDFAATPLRTGILEPFSSDNWHFAFISNQQILAFAVRCLVYCLGRKLSDRKFSGTEINDALLGHAIVFSQYEWPKLNWLFTAVMKKISTSTAKDKRTKFSYPKLFNYVHCMDMLEEIAFLNMDKSDELTLDITETETTRKIGASTRHSVRGQKDDVRSMLEAQASVSQSDAAPSTYEIFHSFFNEQKDSLTAML